MSCLESCTTLTWKEEQESKTLTEIIFFLQLRKLKFQTPLFSCCQYINIILYKILIHIE